jgi:hypothetical protein
MAATNTDVGVFSAATCDRSSWCLVAADKFAFVSQNGGWTRAFEFSSDGAELRILGCIGPLICNYDSPEEPAGDVPPGYQRFDVVRGTVVPWTQPSGFAESPLDAFDTSCPASTFCGEITNDGSAATLQDGKWSEPVVIDARAHDAPQRVSLNAISCSSDAACMAVDSLGRVFVFNGSTWSSPKVVDKHPTPPYRQKYSDGTPPRLDTHSAGLTSVSCSSKRFCVAVDYGAAMSYVYAS